MSKKRKEKKYLMTPGLEYFFRWNIFKHIAC